MSNFCKLCTHKRLFLLMLSLEVLSGGGGGGGGG